ncbi:putative ABC transporter, permease [Nocardia nova SH22a]|uniref:Putative ABC transporter, permease n=1 Tax=Nocardia nova SH22a TaxID=1415166 RepID=W5TMT2_9NOCA|nr:ABC transporter permease [Nocardia nova]AHH20572.1 putative ABC transporter, permease [Nocardia nova SH22a]
MTTVTAPPATRPALGGFSRAFLLIELRRILRNRRTVIFALVMPAVLFLVIGGQSWARTENYGSTTMSAFVMVSVAVYGAMLATTTGGAAVAVERAAGWARQLRLTPLSPAAYVVTKLLCAMTLGFASVAAVFIVGAVLGTPMSAAAWVSCFLLAWLTSVVFAAFGLFMGYLLPSENVTQILSSVVALLSFGGGLFFPMHGWAETASRILPTNGVATLARLPLGDTSAASAAVGVLNVVVWTALFGLGAAVMFRRDTAR